MKYKMVIFDLDGTIVDCEDSIWTVLHEHLETDKEIRDELKRKFLEGEISYKEWVELDVGEMKKKNADKNTFLEAMKKVKLVDGAIETLEELKNRGYKLAVVSGSLSIVIDYFSLKNFFDDVLVNKILFDEKGNVMKSEHTPFDYKNKKDGLYYLAEKFGINPEECVFIGDNFNDVSIAKSVGLSIAFNPKDKELEKISNVVIKKKDLREILKFIQ